MRWIQHEILRTLIQGNLLTDKMYTWKHKPKWGTAWVKHSVAASELVRELYEK